MTSSANVNNPAWDYAPAKTNVQDTWAKHGWAPTTDEERAERRRKIAEQFAEDDKKAAEHAKDSQPVPITKARKQG